jgi:hypothetical protein
MSFERSSQARVAPRALRAAAQLVLSGSLCSATLLGAGQAHALNSCVPPPAGVVGMPGPPDWTLGGTPEVDDPRWHGASGEGFPDLTAGGSPDAKSRLVQSGGNLFLQLHVLADATPGNVAGTNFRDSVYVAFATADLMTINVVRAAIDGAGATHLVRWTKTGGGAWSVAPASPGAPAWLSAVTAWVNPPMNGAATTQNWAINFKIATGSVPGTKFWYGTTISPTAIAAIQTYAWPNRGGFVEPNPPDTGVTASTWGDQFDLIGLANWGDYTTTPAGCEGVKIESDDIGTTNSPSYKIKTNADNTFQAQLSVTGGAAMPGAGAVKARFRIANWGMQIGVGGDWHDVPGGAYTDNRTNNAGGLIQSLVCPYVGPDSCPPHPAGAPADQCMLVELEPAAGPVTFRKMSAWRNMIFGPASEFIHDAEISLVGLPPDPTPKDIYIYVRANNMPAKVVTGDRQTPANPDARATGKPDRYARYRLEGMNSTELRIAAGEPTYEVRGYRDTGLGKPGSQLLTPMVPFGYMMEHSGSLVGWTHQLVGVGTTTVTTIIPDVLYKISVLPGSTARVQTRIQALENTPGPTPVHCPHCCCDFSQRPHGSAYFALAGLAGLALRTRRWRRRGPAERRE